MNDTPKRKNSTGSVLTSRMAQQILAQLFLLGYTVLAVYPVLLIVINSFKTRKAIFGNPYALPNAETWSLGGYETVRTSGDFTRYFINSLAVVGIALALILVFGAMMAFALSEYDFRGNTILSLYMSVGIMIPIKLGTVSLLRLNASLGLNDTIGSLILVYTASGLPLCIFVLTAFMRDIPKDLKDAARVDGASEYRIFALVLPLVRPALGTVAVFNIIPIWNDLWFPLIFISSDSVKTVTLGAQVFLGQFKNDYSATLAALTLSMVPVVILYVLFARQLVRGLTAGAVK
jgi:raffinose/stachyose/melibiose transport system permease protein